MDVTADATEVELVDTTQAGALINEAPNVITHEVTVPDPILSVPDMSVDPVVSEGAVPHDVKFGAEPENVK